MYEPKPIDTDSVTLPEPINDLVEQLAASVHDTWAQAKIAKGYKYGETTSDADKTHCDLIPYTDLSEDKKVYDRNTVLATIKGIYALGFRVAAQNAESSVGAPYPDNANY